MTGPEHYLEAERLLAASMLPVPPRDRPAGDDVRLPDELVAAAQVHATLATCAAQVLSMATSGLYPEPACGEWEEVVRHDRPR
jgi:hypothetical protein